jgi:multidrug efflux system membrane fusion protein
LAAQADLKTAEIDLDHAYVKAPISGRVSRAEITIGNFVGSGAPAPVLASIVSEDGIYADFEVDEQTYLDTIRDAANGNAQEETIPVQLVIPEDPKRVFKGFVQNFDNRLNSSSGTIRARARFDNSDGSLVPGMFVSVRLASSQERKLILVNDRSISFDQSKTTVLTVTLENKVAYREIVLGAALVGKHVALKGLRDGDRVIVTGVQRVRPGALVAPKEYDPREEDTPAAEATAPVKED